MKSIKLQYPLRLIVRYKKTKLLWREVLECGHHFTPKSIFGVIGQQRRRCPKCFRGQPIDTQEKSNNGR